MAAATWVAVLSIALPISARELPWDEAGLTERQAAAHLLDRFAYGPRPGDVDRVVEMGLEAWIERQLEASSPDSSLEIQLAGLDLLELSATEIARRFPNPGRLLRAATESGSMEMDAEAAGRDEPSEPPRANGPAEGDPHEQRRPGRDDRVRDYMEANGYRPQRELLAQLMVQKLFRAVGSENQLREVLVDFFFNHFSVSAQHNQARPHLLSYERDVIRPHVLGDFRELLGATARHPAMLLYLDNATSRAEAGRATTLRRRLPQAARDQARRERRMGQRDQNPNRPSGLNENYARELLELHTLGVDGGYDQEDVVEVARAFTGWVYLPPEDPRLGSRRQMPSRFLAARAGLVQDGLFAFHPGFHDAEKKTVLGVELPAGQGIEDGERVLDLLAFHPATARHLSHKLAVRFVADEPPPELVERLAASFLETRGDLAEVMRALVESPEFWSSRRQKIKTPFELTVSAIRALDAHFVAPPREVLEALSRMGQPLYSYQAPTGYPDTAEHWVNTGGLLNRMSFGVRLASGSLRSVSFDLEALLDDREPESAAAALELYAGLLLPERDVEETVRLLEPTVGSEDYAARVESALESPEERRRAATVSPAGPASRPVRTGNDGDRRRPLRRSEPAIGDPIDPTTLEPRARAVALILGSPEFQRR